MRRAAKSIPKRHGLRHALCTSGERMKQTATNHRRHFAAHHPGTGERASAIYAITGLGALTTAVGLLLCGRRSRALLVAQWVAPLLLASLNERIARRDSTVTNTAAGRKKTNNRS